MAKDMLISILLSKYYLSEMWRSRVLSKHDEGSLHFAAPSSPSIVLTARCAFHGMWQIASLEVRVCAYSISGYTCCFTLSGRSVLLFDAVSCTLSNTT